MGLFIPRQVFSNALFSKHFPPSIAMRFQVLKDSEIFKPSEDEGTWNRVRDGNENWHILFDMVEIMEIVQTQRLTNEIIEIIFLRNFADAIRRGVVSIDKLPDLVTTEEARRSANKVKVSKAKRRHEDVVESYKYAIDNPMSIEESMARIKGKEKKQFKLKK